MILFGFNRYIESDFGILLNVFFEFIKAVFLIEPITIGIISGKSYEYKLHSKRLIDYIGEWDTLFSNASLRTWLKENNYNYSNPSLVDSKATGLRAKEMYNPLLPNCITNDIDINNTIIITGSNMSGKSTFLRSIGINIVSGYALNICYASRMELMNYKLYKVLSVSDDINSYKSYFFSEVERIKQAIDMCEKAPDNTFNIILIDEVFKGTNTIERISIANAVIKYFINLKNTIVIVSTHDIELAKSFTGLLECFHFDESFSDGRLVNDYKIKLGVKYNRNAIALLKHSNYPAEIIACAEQNVSAIEKLQKEQRQMWEA